MSTAARNLDIYRLLSLMMLISASGSEVRKSNLPRNRLQLRFKKQSGYKDT